jgi:hypothetical protein
LTDHLWNGYDYRRELATMAASRLKGEPFSRRSPEKGRLIWMLSLSSDAGGSGYADIDVTCLFAVSPSQPSLILELGSIPTWVVDDVNLNEY